MILVAVCIAVFLAVIAGVAFLALRPLLRRITRTR